MSEFKNERASELHNLAAHAHTVAASAHLKGDHLTAHELTKRAHERSLEAHNYANGHHQESTDLARK